MIDRGGGGHNEADNQSISLVKERDTRTTMAHGSFSTPRPTPRPVPYLLCPRRLTLHLRAPPLWLPVWLCQLENQHEIQGEEERVEGMSSLSPPCLASCSWQWLCPFPRVPLWWPFPHVHFSPGSSCRPQSFPLLLVHGCFRSPLESPAPASNCINNPCIKLSLKPLSSIGADVWENRK